MEGPSFEKMGAIENNVADSEVLKTHRDKNRRKRGSGINSKISEAEQVSEIPEFVAANDNFSDREAIEPITEAETPVSKAENLARLQSLISQFENRTVAKSESPFIAHNSVLERQTDGGKKLKDVRGRLKIQDKKGPLVLEKSFDTEAKSLSAVEAAEQASKKYLEAYRENRSKKNEHFGLHLKGREALKKHEAEMLAARRQSLLEREALITDPAERARLRRKDALELMTLKRNAEIEGAKDAGRWDHELYDDTIGAWGKWNQRMEDKYGKWKVRAVRAAVFAGIATGVVIGTGAAPAGILALTGYGAFRFARTLTQSSLMQGLGNLYKKNIGERQRSKSEKRLGKLDVHGELTDENFLDFMKRFEKNYNRAQESTLQKKMSWVKAAGAVVLTGGLTVAAAEGIDHVMHGGGGHGGGHGGGTHTPGAKPVAAHPAGPAHPTQLQQHQATEVHAAPKPKIITDRLSIGDHVGDVKINDAEQLLGRFAQKLQRDYPNINDAPPSVRQFLHDFDLNPNETVIGAHAEHHIAQLHGFENKDLIMQPGNSIELNSEGQIVFKFANAKAGDALHAPHVLYDNVHDTPQPTDQFDAIAKQHAGRVGAAAHHAEAHTKPTGRSVEAPHAAVPDNHAQIEAHERLVQEQEKLQAEKAALPDPSDPNYARLEHIFENHAKTLQKHIDAYNTKYPPSTAPAETAAAIVATPEGASGAVTPEHVAPTESHEPTPSETPQAESAPESTSAPESGHQLEATANDSAPLEEVSRQVLTNRHGVKIDLGKPTMYAWRPAGVQDGSTATYRLFDGATEKVRNAAADAFLKENPNVPYVFVAHFDPTLKAFVPQMHALSERGTPSGYVSSAYNAETGEGLPPINREDYIKPPK